MYTIYSKTNCPFCVQAKRLMSQKGIEFKEILLSKPEDIESFKERGFRSVPQIFDSEDNLIGSFGELQNVIKSKPDQWPDNPLEM